ncbi:MAG: FtsX-like permease family protein [Bifidobacteriaceae bacterium]|jgi:putative ABC transport system permease protein|nr:FtsX-like permease family protein [Bifidobacteriaceae bacterium]
MFWRMVVKALARGRSKRLMIAATTALGASVATAMLSVVFDVGDKVNQELKTYGANIEVRARGAAVLTELYDIEDAPVASVGLAEADLPKIKTIFWAFNILDFAPFLSTPAVFNPDGLPVVDAAPGASQTGDSSAGGQAGTAGPEVTVVGTWFSHHLDLPTGEHAVAGIVNLRSWWELDGGWIADQDQDLALIGSDLAEDLGLELGDAFGLDGRNAAVELRVAGIINGSGEEANQVVVPLAIAQRLAGRPGEVDSVEVSALTTPDNDLARKAARNPDSLSISEWETWYCTAYVSSIAYQIEEVLPDAVAKPVRQVSESEGAILSKTRLLMLLVTVLSLIASALAIANLVTASVIERAPQIGLLKAVGASDASVVRLILAELSLVGLFGGALGYGAGLGLAQVIGHSVFGSAVTARPIVALLVAFLVVLVVLGGSLPSIRMLLRLRPADVLHGR